MNALDPKKLSHLVIALESLKNSNDLAKSVWLAIQKEKQPEVKWRILNRAFVHAYQFLEVMDAAAESVTNSENAKKRLSELFADFQNHRTPEIGALGPISKGR